MRVSAIVMVSAILAAATWAVPACAQPEPPKTAKKHIGNFKWNDTKIIKADKASPRSAGKRPKIEPFKIIKKVDQASPRSAGKKPKFNDFNFTHTYDKASPVLAKQKTPLLTSPGLLDASGGMSSTGPAAAGAAPRPAAPAGPVIR